MTQVLSPSLDSFVKFVISCIALVSRFFVSSAASLTDSILHFVPILMKSVLASHSNRSAMGCYSCLSQQQMIAASVAAIRSLAAKAISQPFSS